MGNPDRLLFLTVGQPGTALRLTWARPAGTITGYMVLATRNPFPPHLAPEFFAGRMRDFFTEIPLGPEAGGYQTDRAEKYYCVLALGSDGDWKLVTGLREDASEHDEAPLALDPIEATQPRTLNRARFVPRPVSQDFQVEVYVRSDRPSADALGAMLSGLIDADFAVSARADGFIDNATQDDFRVHYCAVCVDSFGDRRPLRLVVSGFQPLDEPALLDKSAHARVDTLHDAVVEQLRTELRFKSADPAELQAGIIKARDLMPRHAGLRDVEALFTERFGRRP